MAVEDHGRQPRPCLLACSAPFLRPKVGLIGTLSVCGGPLWQSGQAEGPGTPRAGINGCLLKSSILSNGKRQDRTSDREEVGGGDWTEPERERELQRKWRGRERDRETEKYVDGSEKTRMCRDSMGYIHTHMLKSRNFPAGSTFRGRLVPTCHLTHGNTEPQRRCDLLEITQAKF